MPPHRTYVETHLGGGAVLRNKAPAEYSIGLDIDPDVIANARSWEVEADFRCCDALDFLEKSEFNQDTLVYIDPPYPLSTRSGRRYYRNEYTDEDHFRLMSVVTRLKANVIISTYENELYASSLSSWNRTPVTNITRNGLREEVIWSNFEPPAILHDYSVLGENFRERERIKRKATRWVSRLEALPTSESAAIVSAIHQSLNLCARGVLDVHTRGPRRVK